MISVPPLPVGAEGQMLSWVSGVPVWTETRLSAARTVNIANTLTAIEIQALINAQPRNLNGFDLTFQFANGDHELDAGLAFNGFHGGIVYVLGDATEANTLRTNQAVFLDATNDACLYMLEFNRCTSVVVRDIRFRVRDLLVAMGVLVNGCGYSSVEQCYLLGHGKTAANRGVYFNSTLGNVQTTNFSNLHYAISVSRGTVLSTGNDDTGTAPNYGLRADGGGRIGKSGTVGANTQPAGSTADESAATGGEIA
jgi:hypothetical protein